MTKEEALKTYFGYDAFRGGQEAVIDALLAGRDALAIMPTGAGKSLCYQIPALLLPGITLVISPLVSLMRDQVTALVQMGVPAAFLNSSLTFRQYLLALDRARAGKVIGVELNQDAVRDAVQNARRNHMDNIQFYHNDASRFMTKMAQDGERADVVFMDPPRAGSTQEFVEAVAILKPRRVVYVSCNPETMARDLKAFGKKGYKAMEAWPFDMFPHTENTEVVCLLSK